MTVTWRLQDLPLVALVFSLHIVGDVPWYFASALVFATSLLSLFVALPWHLGLIVTSKGFYRATGHRLHVRRELVTSCQQPLDTHTTAFHPLHALAFLF